MTGSTSYIRRRGNTYVIARDSRGRFVRFTRISRAAQARNMGEPSEAYGEKYISFYGTAVSSEGIYKARVDARGKGKDLYYLIARLKEGSVPKRRYRHVYGHAESIEDNFLEYFTYGEWNDCEVES